MVGIQSGAPLGQLLWEKPRPSTPSGQRPRVIGWRARCGSTSDAVAEYHWTRSSFLNPVSGHRILSREEMLSSLPETIIAESGPRGEPRESRVARSRTTPDPDRDA